MKLYMHPVSTTSRPVLLFIADHGLEVEEQVVDLMTGEHMQPAYRAINPSGIVPMLEDDDFRLGESSAILKYLADKVGSPTYPTGLRERARVNEVMDWLNTNLYREYGYNLVYPQIFPHYKRRTAESQDETVAVGEERSRRWLEVLDRHIIGPDSPFLCGQQITIADYLGAGILTLGDTIGCTFADYPNVQRWLANMRALPNWPKVHGVFDGMVAAFSAGTYRAI
ncbi:MAG: glutathione S-transferase family protein [Alphaproteobacteria bacterium]|nr:glutathione S-transferase family protein [Alphaproteobacteria bacterium]